MSHLVSGQVLNTMIVWNQGYPIMFDFNCHWRSLFDMCYTNTASGLLYSNFRVTLTVVYHRIPCTDIVVAVRKLTMDLKLYVPMHSAITSQQKHFIMCYCRIEKLQVKFNIYLKTVSDEIGQPGIGCCLEILCRAFFVCLNAKVLNMSKKSDTCAYQVQKAGNALSSPA